MRIRRMTPGDFSFAVSLTDSEDWAYVENDFARLLDYEPEGCFIAEVEKQPVGLTTATSYGPVAWIGNVMVAEGSRGMGIGTRLVRAAVDHLASVGVKTVHLASYMNTIRFYERLGFRQEFPISVMSIDTTGFDSSDVDVAKETDLEQIAALDAAYFGGNRSRIIQRMWRDFPQLLLKTDVPAGYVIATCTEKSCEVGPLIAESGRPDAAELLLRGILGNVLADRARIFVPHANPRAVDLAKSMGFEEDFRTLRMLNGEVNEAERTDGIYALGALEKG